MRTSNIHSPWHQSILELIERDDKLMETTFLKVKKVIYDIWGKSFKTDAMNEMCT